MRWMSIGLMIALGGLGSAPLPGFAADQPMGTGKIAQEVRETFEATKEYTAQQKAAFQRSAQEQLAGIQKKMLVLRGKIDDASAATRAEMHQTIADLERKKKVTKTKLDELRSTTDAKWTDVKSGVNKALDDLQQSYQEALSKVR